MSCDLQEVSVILPTRNESTNIGFFLESVHPAVELVVVDASTDGTDTMIAQLRPERTRIIRSLAPISPARQLGAQSAQGRWLIFSDADVRFEPGYFDYLATHISGDGFYGPKYATATYPRYSQFFNACQRGLHRLHIPAASGSNMGVRRDVFQAIGGFRIDLPVNEDTELMMRIRRQGFSISYVRHLAVRSLDDRRLNRGVLLKLLHTLARNTLLFINLFIPVPRRWLRHDWGYWRMSHANRSDQ